jgi:hypothetical protein
MDTTKQERKIINFAQEIALKHSDDCYNYFAAKQQEEKILVEMKRTTEKHKVESKPFFKKASRPWCTIV